MNNMEELTAPCGLDCFNCELYEDNLTAELSNVISTRTGIPQDQIACRGCREQDGKHFHLPEGCATLECVKARGIDLCCNCSEFPCLHLAPMLDRANRYPHNMKVYNLCRIKKVGLEKWAMEEATTIRNKYFKGKFIVGKGQSD